MWGCQTLAFPTSPNSYEEHIIQIWYHELPFIVSDHGSRRTWGPGPSRSGFGVQKGDPPPLNQGCPVTFVNKVFAKMHGSGSRGTQDPLYAPIPRGLYWVKLSTGLTLREEMHDWEIESFNPSTRWIFFTLSSCKNCCLFEERIPKINEKETRNGPYQRK